jgi:hypothetical protein
VGSDDGVPAIVDVVIGGGATIGLQVENASDERVVVELIGVGDSGAIQFRQENQKAASEWSSQLRLNAGQKRTRAFCFEDHFRMMRPRERDVLAASRSI